MLFNCTPQAGKASTNTSSVPSVTAVLTMCSYVLQVSTVSMPCLDWLPHNLICTNQLMFSLFPLPTESSRLVSWTMQDRGYIAHTKFHCPAIHMILLKTKKKDFKDPVIVLLATSNQTGVWMGHESSRTDGVRKVSLKEYTRGNLSFHLFMVSCEGSTFLHSFTISES